MTSAFYFENERVIPSSRRVDFALEFDGDVASTANFGPNTHLFTFRPSFTGFAVGDRITIERTAGRTAYGITQGTVSSWRGTIAHIQSVPGSPSQTALRLTLDNDSDALPNVQVIDNIAANSVDRWRIIKMENRIIDSLNQWYLVNTADNAEVNELVIAGRLWNQTPLHKLALIRAVGSSATPYNLNVGVLRTNPGDIRGVSLASDNAYLGLSGSRAQNPTVFGAGSDNALLQSSNTDDEVTISSGVASLFPSGATHLQGIRLYANQTHYLNANPAEVAKTNAAALFVAEEIERDIFFPDGWTPPWFRDYEQWTSVNETGYLVARHIKPKPVSYSLPLNFITPSEAVGSVNTLINKLQREFFLFAYRKGAFPLTYSWCEKTNQPSFAAPTAMTVNINAMGYTRY